MSWVMLYCLCVNRLLARFDEPTFASESVDIVFLGFGPIFSLLRLKMTSITLLKETDFFLLASYSD